MSQLILPYSLKPQTPENADQLQDNLDAVQSWANGGISDDNLQASASVYSRRRVLLRGQALLRDNMPVGPRQLLGRRSIAGHLFEGSAYGGPTTWVTDLLREVGGFPTAQQLVPMLWWTPSERAISGRATRLRLAAWLVSNATAPGGSWDFGLYLAIMNNNTSKKVAVQTGSEVSGSKVTLSGASVSSSGVFGQVEFAAPSVEGAYVLGISKPGTAIGNAPVAANSVLLAGANLTLAYR